jgi:PEGA domain
MPPLRVCAIACWCFSLVSIATLVGIATAQPSAELAREFQEGVDAYRLGEYAEARGHLEAARVIDPRLPGPHRFLAAVAFAEKRYDDCIASAAEALRVAPQSREVEDTRKLHDACRGGAGRAGFAGRYGEGGAISVTASFDDGTVGAAITIDGKASGSTPLYPRPIPAGKHQIKVSRAGSREQVITVDVLPGIVTDVAVALRSATAAEGWIELPAGLVAGDSSAPIALFVDGKAVPLATRIALPPGKHAIVLRRGTTEWSRSVEVTAEKSTKLAPTFPDKPAAKPQAKKAPR